MRLVADLLRLALQEFMKLGVPVENKREYAQLEMYMHNAFVAAAQIADRRKRATPTD
jgi:hypothetical protein